MFGTVRRNRRAHRFIGLFRAQNARAALLALPVSMFHPEGLAMAHLLRRGSRFDVGVFRSASDAFGGHLPITDSFCPGRLHDSRDTGRLERSLLY